MMKKLNVNKLIALKGVLCNLEIERMQHESQSVDEKIEKCKKEIADEIEVLIKPIEQEIKESKAEIIVPENCIKKMKEAIIVYEKCRDDLREMK